MKEVIIMSTHMVAKHALREKSGDIIFGIAARAKERAEKIGSENIINSTICLLYTSERH